MLSGAIQAGGAYLRFFADASEYYQTMGQVEGRLNSFVNKFGNMGVQWTAMGAAMMAPVMFGVKEYAKLETYMLSITSALNDNIGNAEEAVKRLHNLAVQIGVDTRFDAAQVAAAMEKLAIADFNDLEIEVAIRPIIDYAELTKQSTDEAAMLVHQIMSAQKMKPKDVPMIVDMLSTSSRLSGRPAASLGFAQASSGGFLGTMGVPLSEQLAFQVALMRMMPGERAGTALRAAQGTLLAPSKPALAAMKSKGIEYEDDKGNVSLILMLKSFERATEKMTNAEKGRFLEIIFNSKQLEGVADLLGLGDETMALKKRIEKPGSTIELVEATRKGVGFAMDVVNSTMDTLRINFGEALREDVIFLADKFAKLLQWLAEFVRHNPNVARGFALVASSIFAIGTAMLTLAAGSKFLAMMMPLFSGGPAIAGTLAAPAAVIMLPGLIARFPALAVIVGLLTASFFGLDSKLLKLAGTLFLMWRGWLVLSTVVWPLVTAGAAALGAGMAWLWGLLVAGVSALWTFSGSLMVFLPEILGVAIALGVLALAFAALVYLLPDIWYVISSFFGNVLEGVQVWGGAFFGSLSETIGLAVDLLLLGELGAAADTMWLGVQLAFFEGIDAIMERFIGLNEFMTSMMKSLLSKGIEIEYAIKFASRGGWLMTVGQKATLDIEKNAKLFAVSMIPDNFIGLAAKEKANALALERNKAAGMEIMDWDKWGQKFKAENAAALAQGGSVPDGLDGKTPPGGPPQFRESTQRKLESLGKYELRRAEGDNLLVDLLSPKTTEKTSMFKLTAAAEQTAANTALLKNLTLVGVMPA